MRRDLPSGTVTFLFTDIEGSTRLLHDLGPEGYAAALAEHRRLLREAFARHGGVEVDTQGDAFFVAFPTATGALSAAADGQGALADGPVRVRMGLHTGSPVVTPEGYVGMDVHHGARVMSAGHGGQVLVSEATRIAAGRGDLRSLGAHRLKDLSAPQPLWQLGDGVFPPPKSLNQTNLPVQAGPLVGRERELAELVRFLGDHRLVTLVGAGGSGKTRLALQAAADVVERFPHGVWWVPLQALRDPGLVLPTIAATLGAGGELADHLAGKRTLLLLDNVEQLVDAAPDLAQLLARTSELTLLVTSREPLRIAGEVEYALDPLADDDAVALFRERAHASEPEAAVRELCRRLDNLPLAIELAAARTKLLPPERLLARLERRLPLLTGGRRDAPERQRTLRATIEWSHDLLDEGERSLFARLAVFAGGFDVDAAEAVCGAEVETLQALLEKSLLRRWESGRLGMLETVHEYASERLEESGAEQARAAHAEYFAHVAREAEVRGPEHAIWLERLRADHANFRAALAWLGAAGRACERLRLACDLGEYAYHGGSLVEGGRWLDDALADAAGCPGELVARGLAFGALTAAFQGDFAAAAERAESAVALARRAGEPSTLAEALRALALVRDSSGRGDEGTRLAEEALSVARDAGLVVLQADLANNMGYTALEDGDVDRARALLSESVAAGRTRDDAVVLSVALANLGILEYGGGELVPAARAWAESLAIARANALAPALSSVLAGVEALMARVGAHDASARVHGAVDGLAARTGEPVRGLERVLHDDALATTRGALGEALAAAAVAGGHADGVEHVAAEALEWLEDWLERAARDRRGDREELHA